MTTSRTSAGGLSEAGSRYRQIAIICSIGALSNIGVASALYMEDNQTWWVAGIAGGLLGSVWNYAMTSVFTWRVKPAAPKVAVEGLTD